MEYVLVVLNTEDLDETRLSDCTIRARRRALYGFIWPACKQHYIEV